MERFKKALGESIKFAVVVGVYYLMLKVAPDAQGLKAKAITGVITALVAGLVTYLAVDVFLTRTVVKGTWHIDGTKTVDRRTPLTCETGEVASVYVKFECDSVSPLSLLYARVLPDPHMTIQVSFKPAKTLRYVKQKPAEDVSFEENVLQLYLVDGLYEGEVAWGEFSARRLEAANRGNTIKVTASVSSTSRVPLIAKALLRVNLGLDALVLGSDSGGSH